MEVEVAVRTQRAIRRFTDEPIADDDLNAILNAGRRAQSSKNSQPWRFVVVRERETLHALSECGRYAGHLARANVAIGIVATGRRAEFDIGQAAALMMLVAWSRGIGSCIASMHDSQRAKGILGIPADRDFTTVISFGRPMREDVEKAPRRGGRQPLAELVRYERW
jgi:nitroreductase